MFAKRGDMIFAYQLLHNQFNMDTTFLHPTNIPPQGATLTLNYRNLLQVYSVGETVSQWEWLIFGTTYLMM